MAFIGVDGAHFHPCMDSFLGAARGVVACLGEELSDADLWGLSGMAFRTQVHRALAPAGLFPRQWDGTYGRVMQRLGYACIAGLRDHFYTQDDISYLRSGWMGNIERHLDLGLPAIAYGLHGPAFGIINGFDDETENFRVSTRFDGAKDAPVNVHELGLTDPPCVFVLISTGPSTDYDRAKAAREALGEALAHHFHQEKDEAGQEVAIPADLATGMDAFEAWGQALHDRKVAPPWSAALTAAYYLEARTHGAAFLRGTAAQLHPRHAETLAKAAQHFDAQAAELQQLAGLFPVRTPAALDDPARVAAAIGHLKKIAAAHEAAMMLLAETK
ncbi:MAG: hypothetical protein KIS92_19645 [Planctomycetota bacterium]|nr:hypothetical protein [Planctomycetota bacterium]